MAAMTLRTDSDPPSRGAFGQTVRAVAWSFLGIRRAQDHEQDLKRISPVHVVVAGLLGTVLFVVVLIVIVHFVVG